MLCAVLVIICDLKHHLLGYFVFHIIGETARLVGAFAAVLRVVIHFWMMGRLLALFFALAPSIVLIINVNEQPRRKTGSGHHRTDRFSP